MSTSALCGELRKIADGVEFDTIAREWRCKWSPEGDKASLVACQIALESVVEDLNEVDGVKSIERVVCGDCLDFKVSSIGHFLSDTMRLLCLCRQVVCNIERRKHSEQSYLCHFLEIGRHISFS